MALTRPILYSTVAFDAFKEHTFYFNVIGGDQVVRNKLSIIRQSDNVVIYSVGQDTFSYSHTLPAGALALDPNESPNGKIYNAYIKTENSNGDSSENSNIIQFYCFTTPSFDFIDFPTIVESQSFDFTVFYSQLESEALSNYKFDLYDVQGNIIATSGTIYNENTSGTVNVSYRFDGFSNNTTYYIRATGVTEKGTPISTDLLSFFVQYTTPPTYSIIELNNNCDGGYITVKSNLSSIEGQSYPENPTYVDDGTSIDLTGEGDYVLWDNHFSVDSDFTASLWGHDFNDNTTIITMKDASEENILTVNYKKNEDNSYCVELLVNNNDVIYYIYSNNVNVYPTDNLQIWIKRVGYLYQIDLINLVQRNELILNSISQGLLDINILG